MQVWPPLFFLGQAQLYQVVPPNFQRLWIEVASLLRP
jgi:hypothetical protein